jgi:hypothetical protein
MIRPTLNALGDLIILKLLISVHIGGVYNIFKVYTMASKILSALKQLIISLEVAYSLFIFKTTAFAHLLCFILGW